MKTSILKRSLALVALLLTVTTAQAEDIDLFVGTRATSGGQPNVLFVVDNTANWSSPFTAEKTALVNTFSSLTTGTFNIGMMMFTETGGGNSGDDGAYVRAAVREMNATNKSLYAAMINALDVGNDKSNSGKVGKAMQEAYLYFAGLAPYAGNGKAKADYTGNLTTRVTPAALRAVWALPGNALNSVNATRYNPPASAATCGGKNYIIYISNGAAQDSTSDTTASTRALSALGGNTAEISISPSGSAENPADEWARFMKASSLGITVYTIDVNKVTTGQGPGWTALLKSMAQQSGGTYYDVAGSVSGIEEAVGSILSEIQSVNSVFASVSLPVSVNTQGTYLNQVFVGMFRPDPDANPRWAGNLKQYQLGYIGTDLKMLDADSRAAINNQTGFITECARSFWTPTTTNTLWSNKSWQQGTTFCIPPSGSASDLYKASDFPDGNIVEKGGEGYKLRQQTTRVVKTCGSTMATCASSASLADFSSSSVSAAQLGAASTTERDNIINWVKGVDVQSANAGTGAATGTLRRDVHGDVVHSRPVAVNLGTDNAPQVAVFYGANDGLLRAVNGNKTDAIGSVPAGGEMWAFAPPEFYGKFERLYTNAASDRISYPGGPSGGSPKGYGMDGPITAFKGTIGGVSKTFIYASMRRGGNAIYAFDVSNTLTTPASPTFKWKIGCASTGSADCSTGMSGIGQTWSSPKLFTTAGYGSGASPLLIFGGGYDTCEDSDPHTCNASGYTSKGAAVYVVDANTGTVVKTFSTGNNRGIIADVTLVRDSAGQALYGYTSDLGGNVYRITFDSAGSSSWTMTRIAALGCATTSTCTTNRKFMFAPSVVAVSGGYDIMLGSGDREKPLVSYTAASAATNYFFMFKDQPASAAADYPGTADCGTAVICLASLYGITTTDTPTTDQLATKKGWYLGLNSTEQVVTSALTIFGVVTFSTHQPQGTSSGTTCTTTGLGTSRVYNVSYLNAASANGTTSRYEHLSGDGLPPSPVGGMVTLTSGQNGAAGEVTVPFCIGCSKESPLEGKQPTSTGSVVRPKGRLYWYIQK
ncbi:PilC/PilY family type IV pilus protein [Ramlibacter sp.]|uniref:pilus assembly protein n=1 Tax=Ramlibacter sp. TaxID=1917967 RepID=UPI0017DEB098|nr:PilC/PilY family type IV pilus protein [Ramlibacter sp.]MBA2674044.1 pilus assembly protein PilY [Ramlibacter sp.]